MSTFNGCDILTSVNIPNSVTTISDYAFAYCYQLSTILIPDSVTSIKSCAFVYCHQLTPIFAGDVPTGYANAFNNNIELYYFEDNSTWTDTWCGHKTNAIKPLYEGTINDNISWKLDVKLLTLDISGTGNIPNYFGNSNTPWHEQANLIAKINIAEGITSIGDYTFSHVKNLKNITIPDTIISIGRQALGTSSQLYNINIPKSVANISIYAVSYFDYLQYIDVADDNQYYSDINGVLYNKEQTTLMKFPAKMKLDSYTIPDTVTTIDSYAFNSCELVNIDIPNSVEIIGDSAFNFCHSLTRFNIPSSVISIGNSVLFVCDSLDSITVADDNQYYTDVDGVLFNKDMTTLMKYPTKKSTSPLYVIPNTVNKIVQNAFLGCENLTNIVIPNSVTYIDFYAFQNCSNLISVSIPSSVTTIADDAFIRTDSEKLTLHINNNPYVEKYATDSNIQFVTYNATGNVEGDSEVNMLDLLAVQKHIANVQTIADIQSVDMDHSGVLDIYDLLQIFYLILNKN